LCRVIQNKEFAMLFKVLLAGMCSLCLVGTATLASAHEFIVKPDKTQAAKGESVGVQAQAAHVFMISEEAEPVETVVVELIQGNAKEPVKLAEEDCKIITINEKDERLESYYIRLVGGEDCE
jgi:hypothetical protein